MEKFGQVLTLITVQNEAFTHTKHRTLAKGCLTKGW